MGRDGRRGGEKATAGQRNGGAGVTPRFPAGRRLQRAAGRPRRMPQLERTPRSAPWRGGGPPGGGRARVWHPPPGPVSSVSRSREALEASTATIAVPLPRRRRAAAAPCARASAPNRGGKGTGACAKEGCIYMHSKPPRSRLAPAEAGHTHTKRVRAGDTV
ncbi:MAG: hypothetical protein J3K34DRAFT_239167 [Monoraphidium minutum]|nr:MAG: hypothetical protein J3K34DRAFT_239167 [Monoraphidium minutum]